MAASSYNAEIVIRAFDNASAVFQRISGQAQRSMDQTKRSADLASRGLESLKMAAVGAAAGFGAKGAWDWLVKSNSQMEQATVGFTTMLGSAEKAKTFLDDLQQFAAKTPFEFVELREAATKMMAFGFSAEKILPTLTAIGDATSGLGMGTEGIKRVTIALGQVQAKNRLMAEEMLQLTEAGIPAWEILSKAVGVSTQELTKLVERGLVPADKAIEALVKGMEQKFPDMMEKQSKTMGGILSNVKDYTEWAGRLLGRGMFDRIKPEIEDMQKGFKKLVQSGDLERWGKQIGDAFTYAMGAAKQFLPILAGVGTAMAFSAAMNSAVAALNAVGKSATLATIATDGLAVAMRNNPVGWIAAAIGLAAGAYVTYKTTVEKATVAMEGSIEKAQQDKETKEAQVIVIKEQITSLNSLKGQYSQLSEAIAGGKLKSEEMAVAKEKLRIVEEKLIPIIGQEGLERLKQADNYKQAFDAEINAMQEKLDAEKKAVEEAKKIELERTKTLMQTTIQNIETIKAEQNAYGVYASGRVTFYESLKTVSEKMSNIPLLPRALIQSQKEQVEMYQRLITNTIAGSKAPMLEKLDEELSRLRKQFISLGSGISDYGGTKSNLQGSPFNLDNLDQQKEHLLSLGSAFSQVSSAIATGTKSSIYEARDALEDLASAAEKLEGGKGKGLAEAIRGTFDQLPGVVEDKTGKAGKAFLQTLYDMFTQAAGIFEDGGNKIQIQFDLAMAKVVEGIQKRKAEIAKAMASSMAQARDIYDKMTQETAKANKNYATESAKVREKMNEDVKKLAEDFDKTLADRAESLKNWTGLFDEVPRLAKDSLDMMTKNLRDQVDRFDLFYQMIGNLAKRGVDQGLIKELRQMGPKAAPQVLALYQATEDQLKKYVDLWRTRTELAGEEAAGQLENARQDMLRSVEKVRNDADRELKRLKTVWEESLLDIRREADKQLSEIANDAEQHGRDFVAKLLFGMREKYPELTSMINQIASVMQIRIPDTMPQPSVGSGWTPGGIVPPPSYQAHIDEWFGSEGAYANAISTAINKPGGWSNLSNPSDAADFMRDHPKYFHEGGHVTAQGRRPLAPGEVPIIAQEGEVVAHPGKGAVLDFEKVVALLEKILSVLQNNAGVKFDQLSKIDEVHIHNGQDMNDLTRGIARDVLIAAGGVR